MVVWADLTGSDRRRKLIWFWVSGTKVFTLEIVQKWAVVLKSIKFNKEGCPVSEMIVSRDSFRTYKKALSYFRRKKDDICEE